MELNEAVSRILRAHLQLLIGFLVAGLLVAEGIHHVVSPTTYTATARLLLSTNVPDTASQSDALSGTVFGIVDDPALLGREMAKLSDHRDPTVIAAKEVNVTAIGGSGVLGVSVMDRSPTFATKLANALAGDARDAWNGASAGGTNSLLAGVDNQISSLNNQIAQVESQLLTAPATQTAALSAKYASLSQQVGQLESERSSIATQIAQRPSAQLLAAATTPTKPDSSHLFTDLALGALLGLVLGIGLAALLESLRPSLVGARMIGRHLGVPVLGTMPELINPRRPPDLGPLALRVRAAAHAGHYQVVQLYSQVPLVNMTQLAAILENSTPGAAKTRQATVRSAAAPLSPGRARAEEVDRGRSEQGAEVTGVNAPMWSFIKEDEGGAPAGARRGRGAREVVRTAAPAPEQVAAAVAAEVVQPETVHPVRVEVAGGLHWHVNGVPTALVVVTPERLLLSDLDIIADVRAITQWPLLGVIVLRSRRQPVLSRLMGALR